MPRAAISGQPARVPRPGASDPGQRARPHPRLRRIRWIASVARQLTDEADLPLIEEIEDLVIMAYVGMIDDPAVTQPDRRQLTARSRRALLAWAWEHGRSDESLPHCQPTTGSNRAWCHQ